MTVENEGGVRVIRMKDCTGSGGRCDDARAMLHLWQLLTGGHAMRDASVFCHRL